MYMSVACRRSGHGAQREIDLGPLALCLFALSAPKRRRVGRDVGALFVLGRRLLPLPAGKGQEPPCRGARARVQMAAHPVLLLERAAALRRGDVSVLVAQAQFAVAEIHGDADGDRSLVCRWPRRSRAGRCG